MNSESHKENSTDNDIGPEVQIKGEVCFTISHFIDLLTANYGTEVRTDQAKSKKQRPDMVVHTFSPST